MAAGKAGRGDEGRMLFSGFFHLMLSSISTRILTFVLNWLTVKRLSPQEYGLAAQYQLFSGTVLFLAREGFRRGCVRSHDGDNLTRYEETVRTINVAYLSLPAGVLLAVGSAAFVTWWRQLPLSDPQFKAIVILSISAMVEIGSEPLYILCQKLLLLKVRSILEASATFIRCVLTYVLLVYGIGKEGGLLFTYAEMGYSATLFLGYWIYFLFLTDRKLNSKDGRNLSPPFDYLPLLPSRIRGQPRYDKSTVRICTVFARQAVAKQLLGKCDEFVLSAASSQYNQGVYGLVSNLGSLVVRAFLQPFEESAFLIFAKSAKSQNKSEKTKNFAKNGQEAEENIKNLNKNTKDFEISKNSFQISENFEPSEEDEKFIEDNGENRGSEIVRRERLASTLSLSLKLVTILGLVFVSFGPSYSYALISLLYGKKWSEGEAPHTLAMYCFYIFFLALNGISEAFLHAVGSEGQVSRGNTILLLFSLVHLALSLSLIHLLGVVGLVLANCANMAMRVAYSLSFIQKYFQDLPTFSMWDSVPSVSVLFSFAISSLLTHLSEKNFVPKNIENFKIFIFFSHVGVGVVCLAAIAISLFLFEKKFLQSINSLLRGRRSEREKIE